MAFLLFRDLRVEVAVVEVGLGGRLDATNVLQPELTVITPIDFDHEQYLGNSLELIAGEKAGILKEGVPAVFARQRPEAQRVLDERRAALGVTAGRQHGIPTSGLRLHAHGSEFSAEGLIPTVLWRASGEDCPTAITVLHVLGVPAQRSSSASPGTGGQVLEVIERLAEIIFRRRA